MTEQPTAELEKWLTEPLSSSVAESVARLRAADGVRKVCLMPDIHLSKEVCVGAVVATEGVVYPQAVGGDIGCGMAALRFELKPAAIDNEQAAGDVRWAVPDRPKQQAPSGKAVAHGAAAQRPERPKTRQACAP